jgi:polyphosphate kinase
VDHERQKAIEAFGAGRYTNRELSWLAFGGRLLDLAEDPSLPHLERMKFLAIFSQGLDEFFQVRIAGLKDQLASNHRLVSPDGLSPRGQLRAVKAGLDPLLARMADIWSELVGRLRDDGISFEDPSQLSEADRKDLRAYFESDIYPILTPLAIDPSHPFPYISNLSLNLAVAVARGESEELKLARVKVPPLAPRFVPLAGEHRYVLLEDVIRMHSNLLFPNIAVEGITYFRVTRNADIILEEGEADDLLALVETELRRRRFGRAVRLEVGHHVSDEILEILIRELDIHPDDVYRTTAPLALDALWQLYKIDREELKAPPVPVVAPAELIDQNGAARDIFAAMSEQDILIHHPYESFSLSVENFISQAAKDPDVLAIKQTLYRTSGDSTIVDSLVQAAELGKQVAVLVEVKARFDEMANINWAKTLEEAGVHVVYGLVGLKTHLKAALIVRKEGDRLVRYCHLGTGNYNARTARSYEDFGLLTADPAFGSDLTEVFNMLTGYSDPQRYERLTLAPRHLREMLISLIEEEASKGPEGHIVIKVNGLVDPGMIDALYGASMAGARVDLIVRGICSIRPGVPGLSEHIRVRSIVGSILEHSRIYCFGGGTLTDRRVWLSSADLMTRNLDRRIEALFPIESRVLKARVIEFLDLELADDLRSWDLSSDGSWHRPEVVRGLNSQRRVAELAIERRRAKSERR